MLPIRDASADRETFRFDCSNSDEYGYLLVLGRHFAIPSNFELDKRNENSLVLKDEYIEKESFVEVLTKKIFVTTGMRTDRDFTKWRKVKTGHYLDAEYDVVERKSEVEKYGVVYQAAYIGNVDYILVSSLVPFDLASIFDCLIVM